MSHTNMVSAYHDTATSATSGINLYTPESGKIFEPKWIILSFVAGALDFEIDIYDATSGTTDQRMHFSYDATGSSANLSTQVIGPLSGFYFGAAFRIVTTVSSGSTGVSVSVSGNLW